MCSRAKFAKFLNKNDSENVEKVTFTTTVLSVAGFRCTRFSKDDHIITQHTGGLIKPEKLHFTRLITRASCGAPGCKMPSVICSSIILKGHFRRFCAIAHEKQTRSHAECRNEDTSNVSTFTYVIRIASAT